MKTPIEEIESMGVFDKTTYDQIVKNLTAEGVVESDGKAYTIKNINNDPFLRIFNYIYNVSVPVPRSNARQNVKHKQLNKIIEELMASQVLYEHRHELSKKSFLIPYDKKERLIESLNDSARQILEKSDDIADQSHLIMINDDQKLLSYRNDEGVQVHTNTADEGVVVVNLYHDVAIRKIRRVGRSEQYITNTYFKKNAKRSRKAIISLVTKKMIRCSYQKYYYLNNAIIESVKDFYEKNKKLVVYEDGEKD